MPNISREDIDQLNAVLTIVLEKGDYEPKYLSELSKYRKQASMRGFRKGKTPLSVLKKMYGKAVLAEVVNELLQKELYNYLQGEEMQILGQPLPSDDQEEIDFDLKNLRDFTFKFDLGLVPAFDIQGLDKENHFSRYEVEITEDMIDDELESNRKRHGERVFPEEGIQENDILKISIREMADDEIKPDGIENEFSLLVSSIDDEDTKVAILEKKNGDVFTLNLTKLEKDADEHYIRRHYLGLENEEEREFEPTVDATIEEISRIEPAPLNEEFYQKIFGEDTTVTTEEEARAKIRENMVNYYKNQADALLFRDFQEDLMEKNQLPLPNDFLKRWLQETNSEMDAEDIDKNFEPFVKNLQWSLVRNKLIRQNELKVEESQLIDAFKDRVRGYFGGGSGFPEDMIDNMVNRLMSDEKQYEQMYDELLVEKLHEVIEDKVQVDPEVIPLEAFNEIVTEARQQAEAARQPAPDAAEEE